jgi:signal transduction histidine kinase
METFEIVHKGGRDVMQAAISKPEKMRSARPQHYVAAITCVLVALSTIVFRDGPAAEVNLRLLLLAAVMLSSWLGGLGPGLLATLFGSIGLTFSNSPVGEWPLIQSIHSLRLVEFIIVALLITFLNDRRRKAQRRAEVAQSEAEAANHAKDEFLATVSHELRTPLAAVIGWTKFLNTNQDDRAVRVKAIEVIERNANKQLQLIEDLLDTSQLTDGQFQLVTAATDLARVAELAVDVVRPAANAKGLELQTHIEAGGPRLIADERRLQQVIWNLLSNAVKFTPEGGTIELDLKYTDSQACIIVKDDGIGIEPDLLPHVFERFRQGDLAKVKQGGLGLGLAIARDLVLLHGGTIEVDSRGRGQGTIFVVRLPLANAWREFSIAGSRAALASA